MSGTDGLKPDDSISLDSQVELPSDNEQFDLTAYAVALAFNSVAPPPGMSQAMRSTIEARARDIRTTIDQAPAVSEFTEAGAREKRRKDADERSEVQIGLVLQTQQREREEWARGAVTVAGTTMTGADWQKLSEQLREDDDFRERLMRLYMARGMDREEAEARVERVAEAAEIAAIPPSQRTEEQRETMKTNDTDPSFKRDISDMDRLRANVATAAAENGSKLNQTFGGAAEGLSRYQTTTTAAPSAPVRIVTVEASPV